LVTFGAGAVASSSNKQKCNTKSSTKTEIIALHDKLSDVIWMRYLVECQGYDIDECIIFQDNMSALSLKKNRRMSPSKHTKHILRQNIFSSKIITTQEKLICNIVPQLRCGRMF
jgi:hypothetical protein